MRIRQGIVALVIVVASGCSKDVGPQGCANAPEEGARLTHAEVLEMADGFAKLKREKYEPFDLKFYPERSATFHAGSWWVLYSREPNRWPGDHFSIRVDDKTGKMRYIGGM